MARFVLFSYKKNQDRMIADGFNVSNYEGNVKVKPDVGNKSRFSNVSKLQVNKRASNYE